MTIRVLLVDDHAVVRAGYRALLNNERGIKVVGEVETGEDACRRYPVLKPHVVIMDLSLPGISGLEVIHRIITRDEKANILVISMHEDVVFVEKALKAGARGYLPKNTAPESLSLAIRQIANGEIHLDAEIAQRLAYQKTRGDSSPFIDLSSREFEIFRLLAEGRSTSEIADRLSLGNKTVANYSTQIKNKMRVNSVAELTRIAIRYDLIKA